MSICWSISRVHLTGKDVCDTFQWEIKYQMFRHHFWPLSQWDPSCEGECEWHAEPPYMDGFPRHKSECIRGQLCFLIKTELMLFGACVESIQQLLNAAKKHQ